MFRRFSRPVGKNQSSRDDDEEDYLLVAEFLLNEATQKTDCLIVVVTDGSEAWKARVDGDTLQKMVNSGRLDSVDEFVKETKRAFRETELDTTLTESTYIVEGKPVSADSSLELKWKISHTGFAQVLGQVKLLPAADAPALVSQIMESVLIITSAEEREVVRLEREEKQKSEAIAKLQELSAEDNFRTALLEESVRILNTAKEKNRKLGTETMEQYEQGWETATQATSSTTQMNDEEDD